MAIIRQLRDHRILTNNPLVPACLEGRGPYTISFYPEKTLREILVMARDLVYAGHALYTHPLSGSLKPNETPYKSVIVSTEQGEFDAWQGGLMEKAIATADKFPPIHRKYSEQELRDFQLIDYDLLAGSIGLDGLAGLSNLQQP